METLSPEMMLYRYFLSNFQNPISFARIKSFTECLQELSGTSISASGILNSLLRVGSIEYVDANIYGLSPSCLVMRDSFTLGVNLSNEIRRSISSKLIFENGLGLGIYHEIDSEMDFLVPIVPYRFDDVVSRYRPLRSVLKDSLQKAQEITVMKAIERYDPMKKIFVPVTQLIVGEFLYRIYPFGQHHFYYLHQQKNTESSVVYKSDFERSNLERLSMVKTVLELDAQIEGLVYLKEREILAINHYQSFPVTIEKLLYINHVLTQGAFPERRQYHLSLRNFNQFQRLFNNKIIIKYAKHIPDLERD